MEQEHKQLVIGILAHVDSGKTTLSEALLYGTGTIRKLGRVDHKDAFLDTDALEKARGITIFSKQALFTAGNTDFTLLDTPGHVDFSTETERSLQVLDYAVLVISGTDGVQSHTRTLWRLLARYGVPTFLFINKMDLTNPGRQAILEQLRRLDRSATRKGTVVSVVVGVISCLLLGIGMCCTMVWMQWFVPGVVIGVIGIVGIAAAYPLYTRITRRERERLAPQILKLTEELSRAE